ncbi:hypothetical protein [Planctomycetes bacterium K23_9]|uniref:Secreted protein n=1 Tax=Stieleria marina TaxID=1930275 RepID=A0A517NY66_9BACT|nr:hypothetical protein K239x_40720 [Planctomycetes bacterium K23_9]
MKKLLAICCVSLLTLSFVGCADSDGDVVGGAELSEIEKYQAAEAAEQASMDKDLAGQAE